MRKKATRIGVERARRPSAAASVSLVYTAQDVARFCEVDLKTIHHWADGAKIPHHRTLGRHLRFRRNHLVQFLRAHGYPLHDEITSARPTVFLADDARWTPSADELAKKLSARFVVRRFEHALGAIANLVAGEPDALVCSLDDPTWAGAAAIAALKTNLDTSWPILAIVSTDGDVTARDAGADLVLRSADIARLNVELARTLGVE